MLDLFCGAGGAAAGYIRAGFDVIGIDIEPQPEYPGYFVQMDVMDVSLNFAQGFDFIHASPPCQAHSSLTKGTNKGNEYPDYIERTRVNLRRTGVPYVIENVAGAPISKDLMLCGEMFGLGVIRHRYFEFALQLHIKQPPHLQHRGRVAGYRHGEWYDGPYFAVYGQGGGKGTLAQWQQAMEINHITKRKSLAESIPPAYTYYIGKEFLNES